jgi:hypothetical protein
MNSDGVSIEPGYHSETLDPGDAERLVLRFPRGDILVLPLLSGAATGGPLPGAPQVTLELELRGPAASMGSWSPSIRRREGILVVADEGRDGVYVAIARVRSPAAFRDLEVHSDTGCLEIRDLPLDILASTESGSIRVSGGASVEVASASGDIDVESSAVLTARVSSGALRVREVAGYVSVESQSGDVSVEASGGNVVVLSASGDVAIQRPGGRLRVATTTGDVELEIAGHFAGGEVSTASGDVSLSLTDADLELRAETLSGDLEAPGAELSLSSGPRRCALRLGAGGRRLHVRSVSGDVEIDS